MFKLLMRLRAALLFIAATVLLQIPVKADGFIVVDPPTPILTPFPLEVLYHNVAVNINGQFAETTIDQVFYNPTVHQLEGYYLFPIPKGAIIEKFTMEINGKETSAELLDATKAREIYEEIVRRTLDPALLEYSETGVYRVRIFPIEPNSEKKVVIKYREVLSEDNNTFEYVYPLNTEKFSAKPLKNVSVSVDIKSMAKLKNVYSPTHNIDVVWKNTSRVTVAYEEQNVKPDIDFKLYFNSGMSDIGLTLLSYKEPGEDGYFFISTSPVIDYNKSNIIAKDIAFVLDVSGSMAGDKLKHAKNSLNYCIDNLNDRDRFEIIKFSTEAYALFKGLVDASDANRDKAGDFVNDLNPVGGTNIEEALNMALGLERESSRPYFIVFITDGKPTIGERDENKLVDKLMKKNGEKTRIFTFGIGDEINTHLLDKITLETNATRTYVYPSEDIEIKITSFYDKVQSPVLTDIEIDAGSGIELYQYYPSELPDIFKGSNLTLLGRYKNSGNSSLTLYGKVNGKPKRFKFDVEFTDDQSGNNFIAPLWASRRIGHLLDLIRLNGESKELVDEVTMLAREHGIVTPYTSYLIMEDEEIRLTNRTIRDDFRTLSRVNDYVPETKERFKKEYADMEEKSGDKSVRTSTEFESLNSAENLQQTQQGAGRMGYTTTEGTQMNLTQQVKNIQGRAVFQTGEYWVDSKLQMKSPDNSKRIKFASEAYFELLKEQPESAQFLALGKNVRFYLDDTYYEIYE